MLIEPTNFARLYLFRHPELDGDAEQQVTGDADAALSRRGRATVLAWRERLDGTPLAAIWSGGQRQCREPAAALAVGRELEVSVDARLVDQHMGRWQGAAWEELARQEGAQVRQFFADFGSAAPPGGESLGAAVERVLAWWTATAPESVGRSLAVVLPGGILTGFVAALLGMRLSRCFSLRLPAGGLGVVDVYQNGVHLAAWNAGGLDRDPAPADR